MFLKNFMRNTMINFIKSLFLKKTKAKYIAEPDAHGRYYITGRSEHSGEHMSVLAVNVKKEDIEKTVKMLERNPIEIFVKEKDE